MKIGNIAEELASNAYHGRGIIMGRSADNSKAVMAYFIMGRSVNSRNRVFAVTDDGIRTQAFDPAKMVDPSLILYHPVRCYKGKTIITNGDHTDTIWNAFKEGHCYRHALNTRTFEPDAPHYTPRISGVMKPNYSYNLSIIKSFCGNPEQTCRYFYEYDAPIAGYGHFVHTYMGDGDPLPSFEGEPKLIRVECTTAKAFADLLWNSLNAQNKVSLFVRYQDIATGVVEDVIENINE